MNIYEQQLLKHSYKNYLRTGNTYFEHLLANGDEMAFLTEAASFLSDSGYIIPISANISSTSINVITEKLLQFELTEKGILYAKSHLDFQSNS